MKIFLTVLLIFITVALFAEDWKIEADAAINLSQNAYSDNWVGNEIGSVTWTMNANLLAEKQLTQKLHNKNTLKLAFGQTHNQFIDDDGERHWYKPDKSTDLVDFESILRFTLGAFVDPFAGFRLETQFLDQTMPDESKIFNPITLTESFGVAKILVKSDTQELSTRFGAAFKQYINSHEYIENTNDGGAEFVTDYRNTFNNGVMTFTSKLNLYKAVFYSESDNEVDDNWKAVDMTWENILSANIFKMISLNLYTQLLYDEQIIDEVRFKETLGLGVTYKFF